MTPRFLDRIWHVAGSLRLPHGQSVDETFTRLDPLFDAYGTSHQRAGNTLSFSKQDPAAQDRMAVFDRGELKVEQDAAGPVLRYRLNSRMLMFCFLLPLLFIGIAQATVWIGTLESAGAEEKKKDEKKEDLELPQHWIDKALGAPVPEKPGADKKDEKKNSEKKNPRSPTTAYVFAGIFAALYVIGRVLEDRKVKALFRKALGGGKA
ncbi:hypothetical protein V5740_11650 [Croceibacterium sp. TMG7-5b_MA50]|uniref:hypothetical protein n=1 Tax=Croceibacterium sp. TMG7-5b_MA50 TaxID=3121290 RepID=UPI0032215B9A